MASASPPAPAVLLVCHTAPTLPMSYRGIKTVRQPMGKLVRAGFHCRSGRVNKRYSTVPWATYIYYVSYIACRFTGTPDDVLELSSGGLQPFLLWQHFTHSLTPTAWCCSRTPHSHMRRSGLAGLQFKHRPKGALCAQEEPNTTGPRARRDKHAKPRRRRNSVRGRRCVKFNPINILRFSCCVIATKVLRV